MAQLAPAALPFYRVDFLMPAPGPLGRLVRRRRLEMGLTQPQLAELVGCGIKQNTLSRLESGKTQRLNDQEQLDSLAHVLGYESDVAFILAAHAPHTVHELPLLREEGPEWEFGEGGEMIRIVFPRLSPERKRQLSDYARYLAEQEEAG